MVRPVTATALSARCGHGRLIVIGDGGSQYPRKPLKRFMARISTVDGTAGAIGLRAFLRASMIRNENRLHLHLAENNIAAPWGRRG